MIGLKVKAMFMKPLVLLGGKARLVGVKHLARSIGAFLNIYFIRYKI